MKTLWNGIIVLSLLVSGCHKNKGFQSPQSLSTNVTILDEFLTKESVLEQIRIARENRPDDIWHEDLMNGHMNVSKWNRETAIATELLKEIEPRLNGMTTLELFNSLATSHYIMTKHYSSDVAYCVYYDGNRMIINKLKERPKSELEELQQYDDPMRIIFDGEQGPGESLFEVIHRDLLGQTNWIEMLNRRTREIEKSNNR